MGIINKVSYVLFGLFYIFGIFMTSIIIHEYVHYYDFKDYVENDGMCIVANPFIADGFAYYSFDVSVENSKKEEFKRIDKYTELKASIITLLFFGFTLLITNKVMDDLYRRTL